MWGSRICLWAVVWRTGRRLGRRFSVILAFLVSGVTLMRVNFFLRAPPLAPEGGGGCWGGTESRDGGGSARPSLFKTAAISGKSDATERTLSTPVVCEVPGVVHGAVQMGRFWRCSWQVGPVRHGKTARVREALCYEDLYDNL